MSVQLENTEILNRIIYQNQQIVSQNERILETLQSSTHNITINSDNKIKALKEEIKQTQVEHNKLLIIYKETKDDNVGRKVKQLKYHYNNIKCELKNLIESKNVSQTEFLDEKTVLNPERVLEPEPEPEPERNLYKKKVKKVIKLIIIEEKELYSPEEISNMDDYTLASEFTRITGHSKLYCNHCKKEKSIDYWIHSIRKRCMKNVGLCNSTIIPKTCDKQQATNSICNPINNKVYPIVRNPKYSDKKKKQVIEAKKELFEKIGKDINPYKY
jgi:CRISPR/Cas system-associated endoribonuclease Cas2